MVKKFAAPKNGAHLGGRFGFFSASGGGQGGVRGARRRGGEGVGFLLKIPGGVGGVPQKRGGGGGTDGPRGCLQGIFFGGGGAKYFFSGPKCPPSHWSASMIKILVKKESLQKFGVISWSSPNGEALQQLQVGDRVSVYVQGASPRWQHVANLLKQGV